MDEFAGKAVIVTGASGGIGCAAALEFARRGALVAMVARSLDRLSAAIPEELRARCFPVAADVSTAEGCEAAYKGCITALGGRLDVLVNNAGGALLGTRIAASDEEWWDYHMDLNVKSVVRLTRHCSALLTESRGCIVNLSSIAASRPFVGGAAYCTAKCAAAARRKTRAGATGQQFNPSFSTSAPHARTGPPWRCSPSAARWSSRRPACASWAWPPPR